MRKEIVICDLCGEKILHPFGQNVMVYAGHTHQKWNEKDICKKCCCIFDKAINLGLIPEVDKTQFYEQAGWEKTGTGLWRSPDTRISAKLGE